MTGTTPAPSPRAGGRIPKVRFEIWLAILSSLIICSAMAWLHLRHQEILTNARQRLETMRLARIELAKGFLAISLADAPGSPFQRTQGVALLQQALSSFTTEVATLDALDTATAATFRDGIRAFQSILLDLNPATAGKRQEKDTLLRISYHELERLADAIDARTRHELLQLRQRLNQQFILAFALSVALLAAVSALLFLVGRARDAAEKARRDMAWRHLTTLRSIGDGVIVSDPRGHVELLNPVAEALTGWRDADAQGKPLGKIFHIVNEETGEVVENPTLRVRKEGITVGLANHTLLISADGTRRPIADSAAPIKDDKGEVMGVVLVFRDQSHEHRMRRELRESELHFRTLANGGRALIWTSGLDMLCNYFNEPWLRYTGRTLEQELGDGWAEGVHPDDLERCLNVYTAAFARREPFSMEYRLRHAGGEYRWIVDDGAPRFDSQGNFLGYIGFCFDITERKQNEEALTQAKNAAESANKSKSEFLANMSHEIRTPLNGVLGMLQLMGATELEATQQKYLRIAMESSRRLTQLLSDILDLSRIEADKMVIQPSAFNLAELKDSVLEVFSLSAAEKSLELAFTLDERLPAQLVGDVARLRQILFNLLGNAIKFTEAGYVRVHAQLLPFSRNDTTRILFTVSDTGIGISDDLLKIIFEPFVQAEGSYTRRFQGAGLGLSIVRRLVRMMDGELAVDNTHGEGATIYLSLPFQRHDEAPAQQRQIERPAVPRSLRVLLAEDDEGSIHAGQRMLEKFGHTVTTAVDGYQALQLLAERDFDLVLMDVQMPVMDGVEAVRAIRTSPAFRDKAGIPVIAMTAYAMAGDREKFLAAGMDGYVSKPVDMTALKDAIAALMPRA